MSQSQSNKPSGSTTKLKYTYHDVLKMYEELDLKVCDDGNMIEEAYEKKKAKYVKMLKSPDPAVSAQAKWGMESYTTLSDPDKRKACLEEVYEKYKTQADISITGVVSEKTKTFDSVLAEQLKILAIELFNAVDDLAETWRDRFIKEKKYKINDLIIPPPAIVQNFKAFSGYGKIHLSWQLPDKNCEYIEITRSEGSGSITELYKGTGSSFVDKDVKPGIRYEYHARSIFKEEPGSIIWSHAVCLGEATDLKANWNHKEHHVRLEWKTPGAKYLTRVFRRKGNEPQIRIVDDVPCPENEETKVFLRDTDSFFIDTEICMGETYFYTVIVDFGENFFSKGVSTQVTIPKPPPTVKSVLAEYKQDHDKNMVSISWDQVDEPVEYVLVRRDGDTPAAKVDDGKLIFQTTNTKFIDEKVEPGHKYIYTVFTYANKMYSPSGSSSTPVDILPEITDLAAVASDGCVDLSWKTPDNVRKIIVRRGVNKPLNHLEGTPVKLTGVNIASDIGLHNGITYHYRICCVYCPGSVDIITKGVLISATPVRLPKPIKPLKVEQRGKEALCTWQPVDCGTPVLVRFERPHGLVYGHRINIDQLRDLESSMSSSRIPISTESTAIDQFPDHNHPYYGIFTIEGTYVVVGDFTSCFVCEDISSLKLRSTPEGIILRWNWPKNSNSVLVVRRNGQWPDGWNDPAATLMTCYRHEYTNAGEKFVDMVRLESHARLYYIVYVQIKRGKDTFYSPGTDPSCRGAIEWKSMTLDYSLSPASGRQKTPSIQLNWSMDKILPEFTGFKLMAYQDCQPTIPPNAIELYRWTQGNNQTVLKQKTTLNLEPIQKLGWPWFHCKIEVIDPTQADMILIRHPNTSIPISNTGKFQKVNAMPLTKVYSNGTPGKIMCPLCFSEFSIDKILYTSFIGNTEPLHAKRTIFDILSGRPPRVPTDEKGNKLSRKICPVCKEDLPYTAGEQKNLIIGLVGPKHSGKSTYIAILIQQLRNQISGDFQASLWSSCQKTDDRYDKDYYQPLIKVQIELPATAGSPPPLIYDLTLNEMLWREKRRRGITLALYDTAGENLSNPQIARQTAQYMSAASGIILILDPLQIPWIREQTPPSFRLPEEIKESFPGAIVNTLLTVLEEQKLKEGKSALGKGEPLSIPVAVVLNKCDVLQEIGLIPSNRLWNMEKRHIGYYNTDDHNDMTGMWSEYIQKWCPAAYSLMMQRFPRRAFFGMSSTGCASDKNTRYPYIAPFRASDPLLWLLSELQVIPDLAAWKRLNNVKS